MPNSRSPNKSKVSFFATKKIKAAWEEAAAKSGMTLTDWLISQIEKSTETKKQNENRKNKN